MCDECYVSVTGTIAPSAASRRVAKSTDESSQVSKAKQNLAKVATRKFRESKHPASSTNTLFNPNSYSSLVPSGTAPQTVPSSAPALNQNGNHQAPKKINLQDIFKSPIIQQNSTNGEAPSEQYRTLTRSEPNRATETITPPEPVAPSPVTEVLANRPKPPSRPGTPNGSRIIMEEPPKPGSRIIAIKSDATPAVVEYSKPKPPPRNISKQNLYVSENEEASLLSSLNTYQSTTPSASPISPQENELSVPEITPTTPR